jgi:hypothetical protein
MREVQERLDLLDARASHANAELREELDTVLRALELIHDDDPGARRALRKLRATEDYDAAFAVPEPLVSIVIPTWNRLDALLERAIPSALAQTHKNIELLVVGDASPPELARAVAALSDPRITFHNLTIRGPYDVDAYRSWLASGTPGFNSGVAMANGLWIAPLGDDDEFESDHVERLLAEARERRLEFVYSRGRVLLPDGRETILGEFPPRLTQVGLQASLYHAGLSFIELELGHALFDKPNDWGMVHRMMRIGVRIGMLDDITVTYRPSLRAQTPAPTAEKRRTNGASVERVSALESRLAELTARASELDHQLATQHHRNEELAIHAADLSRRLEEVRVSRSWRLTAPLRRLRGRAVRR